MSDRHDQSAGEDAFVERIAAPLRTPEHASPDFEDALIAAIQAHRTLPPLEARRARPLSRHWWSTATIHLTPLGSLAIAAGIAAFAVVATRAVSRSNIAAVAPSTVATAATTPPGRDTVTLVRFVFVGEANSVTLVGDFNRWGGEPVVLDQTAGGAWTTSIPLPNGRHEYAFIVDGERWVADPLAPSNSDEFDTRSSVITVGT